MAILYPHHIVGVEDLPVKIKTFTAQTDGDYGRSGRPAQTGAASAGEHDTLLPMHGLDLKEYLANLERSLIGQALDDSGGVVARAASRLHMRRTTLVEKMRKYQMQRSAAALDSEFSIRIRLTSRNRPKTILDGILLHQSVRGDTFWPAIRALVSSRVMSRPNALVCSILASRLDQSKQARWSCCDCCLPHDVAPA